MRNAALDALWTRDFVNWVVKVCPTGKILDYGCGLFGTGRQLIAHGYHCDGYEPDPVSLAQAKQSFAPSVLSNRLESFESQSYQWVIVNSVVQYFNGEEELMRFLEFCSRILKPGGKILIADLIPSRYSPVRDAMRSLVVAARHGMALVMLQSLFSARNQWQTKPIFRVDLEWLRSCAQRQHYRLTLLEHNLTPSMQRYSVVLEREK